MLPSSSTDDFSELSKLLSAACQEQQTQPESMTHFPLGGFKVTGSDELPSSSMGASSRGISDAWSGARQASSSGSTLSASAAPFQVRAHTTLPSSDSGLFSLPLQSAFMTGTWPPISASAALHAPQSHQAAQIPLVAPIPEEWVKQHSAANHIVTVQNLDPRTTKKLLFDVFFPMGACDAAVLGSTVGVNAAQRRGVGIVMFSSADMAKIAAEKLNDFVPHGQSFPLIVAYVPKSGPASTSDETMLALQATVDRTKSPPPLEKPAPSSLNAAAPLAATAPTIAAAVERYGGIVDYLVNVERSAITNMAQLELLLLCIERPIVSQDELAAVFLCMLLSPQSSRTLVEDAVAAVRDRIVAMGFHSPIFTPPLVGALQRIVEQMEISTSARPSTSPMIARHNTLTQAAEMFTFFKRSLCQVMLHLLLNKDAEKGCRTVAAITIGYLFELQFLAGDPYSMARKLMEANDSAMAAARQYLMRADPHTQQDEAAHAPSINLVEALLAMTSSWQQRHPQSKCDPNEAEFQRHVRRFYGGDDAQAECGNSDSNKGSPESQADSNNDGPSKRRTPPPTPSSRPTPSSTIVSRVSPVKPSTPSRQPPPSPTSDSGITPLDSSLDSNVSVNTFSTTMPGLWQPAQRIAPPSSRQPTLSLTNVAAHPFGLQHVAAASSHLVTYETTLQKDLLACTVYLTKLPAGLTDAKVRRLISYFGEVNKVRMYKEKTPPSIRSGGTAQHVAHNNQNRGCFGFVEYAQPSSAKAMIDYFRNASMTLANPFHFLIGGDHISAFSAEDIKLLALTRASYAKSAIHDQHPKDAVFEPTAAHSAEGAPNVKVQPCMFGFTDATQLTFGNTQAVSSAGLSNSFAVFGSDAVPQRYATNAVMIREKGSQHHQQSTAAPCHAVKHFDAYRGSADSTSPTVDSVFRLGLFDNSGTW